MVFVFSGRQLFACERQKLFRHYLLATKITISRKLVSMGKKFCLFMCYEEQISTELWMAKEAVALNGGLHNRTMEGKIRRRIWEQCKQVFLLFSLVSSDGRLGLLRLIVVGSDFHCTNDYTMANNMYL